MADDSGIDPRHPAQFQRGFDPHAHPVTPPRPDGPVRLPGGPAAVAERVPPPPAANPAAVAAASAAPAPVDAEVEGAADAESRPTWPARLLEWSLPVLGLVLLLVAISLFGEMVGDSQLYYGYSDATDFAWTQVRASLPGPLLVGGVLAITVWVVLLALRPEPSRR